jgi:hypothetical protein
VGKECSDRSLRTAYAFGLPLLKPEFFFDRTERGRTSSGIVLAASPSSIGPCCQHAAEREHIRFHVRDEIAEVSRGLLDVCQALPDAPDRQNTLTGSRSDMAATHVVMADRSLLSTFRPSAASMISLRRTISKSEGSADRLNG